jgi:hypothetical protein
MSSEEERLRVIATRPPTKTPLNVGTVSMNKILFKVEDVTRELRSLLFADLDGVMITDAKRSFANVLYDTYDDAKTHEELAEFRECMHDECESQLVNNYLDHALVVVLVLCGGSYQAYFQKMTDHTYLLTTCENI